MSAPSSPAAPPQLSPRRRSRRVQMRGGDPLFELNDGVCRRETRAELIPQINRTTLSQPSPRGFAPQLEQPRTPWPREPQNETTFGSQLGPYRPPASGTTCWGALTLSPCRA